MSLKKSKYNIIVSAIENESWFIFNSLYGTSDILNIEEYQQYESVQFNEDLVERGYLVDPDSEQKFFNSEYMNFIDDRDKDEVQIFYVPDYGCNFACDYCYQSEYSNLTGSESQKVIDAFFEYVDNKFAGRKKYFTLFGGEPLLPSQKTKSIVDYFLKSAKSRNLDTAIVSNGFAINEYIDILKDSQIREVQITLDGMGKIHDQRRPLKGGGSTFEKVVGGIDLLIENRISVNLRMVVDAQNINDLPMLARFAIDRGWTDSSFFKTQLGRNYDLHSCQVRQNQLYSRIEMYREVAELIKRFPYILKFHTPSFHVLKLLATQNELPAPVFDSCPGTKTEWAFDYTGKIYSCTATVGKKGEELGTFYPEITLDDETIEQWQDRDIIEIDKCRECNVALVCGGGCASVAKNRDGTVNAPDCRPVEEIVKTGFSLYFDHDGNSKI